MNYTKLSHNRRLWPVKKAIKKTFPGHPATNSVYDDSHLLNNAEQITMTWPSNTPKPIVGLVRDTLTTPYWSKYARFLANNKITYHYYDINRSDWLVRAKDFDIIIWKISSFAHHLQTARRKIYFLEKNLNKLCFPCFDMAMLYEDKILQYDLLQSHGFPVVPTFISFDYHEIKQKIPKLHYPLISKLSASSGSYGVELIKNPRQARKLAASVFSWSGRATYHPWMRQKDYLYLQKYQPNTGYDLRVIVVGRYLAGYYRDVPDHDFRASGMGQVRKEAIPTKALMLAKNVCKKLNLIIAAIDLLKNADDGHYSIIEVSPFFQIDTPEQLCIKDVPGLYVQNESNHFTFIKGRYWLQELALREFLQQQWLLKFNNAYEPT